MFFIFPWILFSVIVGLFGQNRIIGFWGAFLLSLLFSPLIGIIICLFSSTKASAHPANNVLIVQPNEAPSSGKKATNHNSYSTITEELEKLKSLRDQAVITQSEFESLKNRLINS